MAVRIVQLHLLLSRKFANISTSHQPTSWLHQPLAQPQCQHPAFYLCFTLGLDKQRTDDDREVTYSDQDNRRFLPLSDSLEQAYGTLKDLWPEVVEWVGVLVPAFVDLGSPPQRSSHLSGSYGPGSPIFLSKVANPFLHAEDIVHELQHERLLLFLDRQFFARWDDPYPGYVSPYRPDPRPLRGLHIGLHAYVAVNELWLRASRRDSLPAAAVSHMLKIHQMNLFAFRSLLEHEEFSPRGRAFFAQYGQKLGEQHKAIQSLVTPPIAHQAEDLIRQHIAKVAAQAEEVRNTSATYTAWEEIAARAESLGQEAGEQL